MDRTGALATPELQPFLPMLYVAWADDALSADDLRVLRARLEAQPWLKPALRLALEEWLDPARPPSATELAMLRRALERAVGTMRPTRRVSLAQLASAMVDGHASEAATHALAEIESLLALDAAHAIDDVITPYEHEAPRPFERGPRPDVAALRALLDGRHAGVRAKVRAFLAEPARRAAYGLSKEEHRAMVRGWLDELAKDVGMGALASPGVTTDAPDLGGYLAAFETLAYGDLSLLIKNGVQWGLFGGSIFFLGDDAQRAKYLPDVASLRLLGCFAMSEVGHGSNVADLETIARYDAESDEIVVHTPSESARKDWAGNAARDARMATVFAQLEVAGERHGVHAVLVPIRDANGAELPGVRTGDCGHKMGLNGVDNGRIWFDHVRVPRASLLSRHARITELGTYESPIASPGKRFFTMLGTLVGGRVSVAAAAVSASKVGLAIAIRYASERRQFGPTKEPETLLLEYPTHQRRLLIPLATTYALSFAIDELRESYLHAQREGAKDTRELEAHAAGLKAIATWHATKTLQACREACGGQGYLSVNRLADLKSDTDVFTTFEGDNTVLLQLVARELLAKYAKRFTGGPVALVRALASAAVLTMREKAPFRAHRADEASLRDPEMQRSALAWREESLLRSAAARAKKRSDAGMDAQDVLMELQEHLVALAEAHVERRVMDAIAGAVERAEGDTREWLARLRDLHALSTLEARAAWFVENGELDGGQTRAIRKLVPKIARELRDVAVPLVDAFGIPDACLAAPIAFHDPAHPRW
ncbi:acyl-CoA dehydrogenase [Sandaracinus amylolyticus]|uniref:acyl-CoA dehydrogenase family protein n=1 Tax=Sandaracinus amylolyticus TaxID=927083 RepID=UPI001F21ECC4|nr:acyl-CoA dehydrogenase [Sandaracinus amylolyticus]UJR86214.1 Hypothetical protein I5071_82960 [Sandaracinus amylolyticus]